MAIVLNKRITLVDHGNNSQVPLVRHTIPKRLLLTEIQRKNVQRKQMTKYLVDFEANYNLKLPKYQPAIFNRDFINHKCSCLRIDTF